MNEHKTTTFIPVNIALVSVSDRRTLATDDGGIWLQEAIESAGHRCLSRELLRPDVYRLRAHVSALVADAHTQAVFVCGGTGLGVSDISYSALSVLFDVPVDGFGEIFRQLSFADIGTSSLQSRAFAGLSNQTLIACMPSSRSAIALAWTQLLAPQLDKRTSPCNFVGSLKPFSQASA